MPRTVKCALIQCSNAAATDQPIEEIKRLNIEKHLHYIEEAARPGVTSNPSLARRTAGSTRRDHWPLP